jgi:hypothetical protein
VEVTRISTYASAFLVTATCSSGVVLQKTREKSARDNPKVLADSSMSLMMSCFLLTLLSELSSTGSRLLGGEMCTFFPFIPSLLIEGEVRLWRGHPICSSCSATFWEWAGLRKRERSVLGARMPLGASEFR